MNGSFPSGPPVLKPGSRLVIASNNAGKISEIGELLSPFKLQVAAASEFGLPEPEETGKTFADNSAIKAMATMQQTGLPALADDSGLAVTALDGEPCIYSARWAGEKKDFQLAMEKVRRELATRQIPETDWQAAFICDLCLCLPDGSIHHFQGRVDGRLTFPPRGEKGFGYDPIFIPSGYNQTFGEMDASEKQAISHRARAFAKLVETLA